MCCGSTSVEIFQSQQAGPGRPGLPEDEEQEEVRPGPELRAAGDDGPGEGQLRCGHRGCEGGQGGGTRGRPESLNTMRLILLPIIITQLFLIYLEIEIFIL